MAELKDVVIVDDEEAILFIYEEVLEFKNANPKFFHKPEAALEYILENPKQVSVVATDYKMPIMSGFELIQKFYKECPHIKSFIVTGFWKDIPSNLNDYNIIEIIKKPTDLTELNDKLEQFIK